MNPPEKAEPMTRDDYRKRAAVERAFASVRDVSQAMSQVENDLRELRNSDPELIVKACSVSIEANRLLYELRMHPLRDFGDA
jgi:uncharacterized protein YoxC